MLPSVQHLYQELLSILHTVLHIRIALPKSFKYRTGSALMPAEIVPNLLVMSQPVNTCVAGRTSHTGFPTFTAITWRGMNRVLSPKFSESIRCQKMVEIHDYNEYISDNWRGWQSVSCNSVLQHELFGCRLFMVGVKVLVLEHFSILYRLCGCWCFITHYPTQDDEKMCCEVSIKYPFMSCSSLLCLLQMAKNCPYLLLTCFLVQCYCTRLGFSEFVSVARCLSPILQCMNRRRSQCEKHFCTLRRSCSATNAKTLMVLFWQN